jgi:hypothetical protein
MDFINQMEPGGKVLLGLFLLMAIMVVISFFKKKKRDK